MANKEVIIIFSKYIFVTLALWFIINGIHEYMHLIVGTALGGEGYIKLTGFGAATYWTGLTPTAYTLTSYAGGLITGTVLLVWSLFDLYFKNVSGWAAITPVAVSQLVYGLYEGMYQGTIPKTQYLATASTINMVTLFITIPICLIIVTNHGVNVWLQKTKEIEDRNEIETA